MTNCPPKLRGDLTKWLLEINAGVYVGNISARVREALWKRICENIGSGQATMVFNTNNEQHMDFYVHNTVRQPVDLDGLKLIKLPDRTMSVSEQRESSFASKMLAEKRHRKKNAVLSDYVILDIETSGLSPKENEIIEIGAIVVKRGKCCSEHEWLIKCPKKLSGEIIRLTGITDDELERAGNELSKVLRELYPIIDEKSLLIYNADFDIKFLEEGYGKCDLDMPDVYVNDALKIAKQRLKSAPNYRLETIAQQLGLTDKQIHRALADCKLLYRIYSELNKI